MAAEAGSSSTRVVFVLVGLFALILAISSTQVLAAKDLADHRQAAKTTATTQEETMAEMDGSKKDSGSQDPMIFLSMEPYAAMDVVLVHTSVVDLATQKLIAQAETRDYQSALDAAHQRMRLEMQPMSTHETS